MKINRIKGLLPALVLALLMLLPAVRASAASDLVIDWTKTGSVADTLQAGGTALRGAEITLYRVADVQSSGGSLSYSFTATFEACGLQPDALQEEQAPQQLAAYAAGESLSGNVKQTDETGFVKFDGLTVGLYLAVQTGSVAGFSDCTPFLVSMPFSGSEGWVYDVDATPKADVARLVDLTVRKVWNDSGKEHPESVTIQLCLGGDVIETVTLCEQNGWSQTWTNMPQNDAWSVQEVDVPKGYTPTYRRSGNEFTVVNTPTLIQTGQLNWPVPVLACAGLLLFGTGWALVFSKRNNSHA